jgi:hypothetical protein
MLWFRPQQTCRQGRFLTRSLCTTLLNAPHSSPLLPRQHTQVRGKYGHKHVGCAIFGRSAKFNLIASKRVHLRDYGPLQGCRSHRFHVDFVNKWNALALLMVQIKATGQPLCVGNTHLFW